MLRKESQCSFFTLTVLLIIMPSMLVEHGPSIKSQRVKDWKQEEKGYGIGIRHFTWVCFILYSANADSSPHPPSCNSFIWLFALLWFWFVGVSCLFKESMQVKLRLFPWTKYDLCEGICPQITGFYQGRKFPSPFWNSLFPALSRTPDWAVLVMPSDLLRLCVL